MAKAKEELTSVRLDKWLWAARCYKTRGLSSEACSAGHIKVNGATCKPAKSIRPGDEIHVRLGPWTRILIVVALADKRGPASVARELYEDRSPPPPEKDPMAMALPKRERGAGRPSKRERRKLDHLRRG